MGTNAFRLHDEFVTKDANQIHRNGEVSSNKVLVIKISVRTAGKDTKVLRERNQNAEEQSKIRSPDTQWRDKGHLLVCNALSLAGFDEENVSDQEGNPGAKTEDGHQIDEVAEDSGRILCSVHESAAAEKR